MQENLGITLFKIALLALIAFLLFLNTCEMTGVEDRILLLEDNYLEKMQKKISKIEKQLQDLQTTGVKIGQNNEQADNSTFDMLDTSFNNPYSDVSLIDFCYYNPDIANTIILNLSAENPDLKLEKPESTQSRYSYKPIIEEVPEFKQAIKKAVAGIMTEPMDAKSAIIRDNRNQLIDPEAEYEGTIVYSDVDDPQTYNPLTSNSANFSNIRSYINDTICMRDPANPEQWMGLLTDRATITDNYKTYTFWLKDNLKWHKPALNYNDPKFSWLNREDLTVTAEDFKFTLSLIYNAAVKCDHLRNYYCYKDMPDAEVKIINRFLFQIVWGHKVYQSKIFSFGFNPLPKFIYGKNEFGEFFDQASLGRQFNDHWFAKLGKIVGNGGYIFKHAIPGEQILLERNEDYHSFTPPAKKIRIQIIKDGNLSFQRFKEKMLGTLSMRAYRWKTEIFDNKDPNSDFNNGNILHDKYISNGYNYIGWNLENKFFKDKRVRRAMTHAFDRQTILEKVYYNLGEVATGPFWSVSPFNDKSIKPFEYNLEKAAKLLDEAGWVLKPGETVRTKMIDGEEVKFSFVMIIIVGSDETRTAMITFSEALKRIGVDMTPKQTQWSAMQEAMNDRDFDAIVVGWRLSYEPDPTQIWHSSQADKPESSNYIGFRNTEADEIIDKLRITFEKDERIKLCHQFHKLIHEEQPYTFFLCRKAIAAWWSNVKNYKFNGIYPAGYRFPVHVLTPN